MKNPKKGSVARKMEATRVSSVPLVVPRTLRMHRLTALTSLPAGKCVPLNAVPLFREDQVQRGDVTYQFFMHETAEMLMNGVRVDVKAYVVPWLAFDRFESMDEFNKSYKGQPYREGDDVIPFIEKHSFGTHEEQEFYKYIGAHSKENAEVNTMYLEAYNQIFNYRAKNRSPQLFEEAKRDRLDAGLAPAFWAHDKFRQIVPDFDQAKIDGEVALSVASAKMPVKGIGRSTAATTIYSEANMAAKETGGDTVWPRGIGTAYTNNQQQLLLEINDDGLPQVFAELQDNGITVSLSNIELAKKTQAFARYREKYSQHDDEYIIDMLMDGIRIPEQMYKEPIHVGSKSPLFGMGQQYATNGDDLTKSVTRGATVVSMNVRIPPMNTGGVLMFVAEITPEQMFERQKDPFLHLGSVEELPEFLRDHLDPEKVERVTNDYVDVDHADPDATFGYEPLNHKWNYQIPNIGGRYYRPKANAGFDEDRQRIWASETIDPTLSEDFYLASDIHTKPFADTVNDPFEVIGRGGMIISGNTQFGIPLIEADDDYDKVGDKAPTERIEKEQENT